MLEDKIIQFEINQSGYLFGLSESGRIYTRYLYNPQEWELVCSSPTSLRKFNEELTTKYEKLKTKSKTPRINTLREYLRYRLVISRITLTTTSNSISQKWKKFIKTFSRR